MSRSKAFVLPSQSGLTLYLASHLMYIACRFSTVDLFRAREAIKTGARAPNAQIVVQKEAFRPLPRPFLFGF